MSTKNSLLNGFVKAMAVVTGLGLSSCVWQGPYTSPDYKGSLSFNPEHPNSNDLRKSRVSPYRIPDANQFSQTAFVKNIQQQFVAYKLPPVVTAFLFPDESIDPELLGAYVNAHNTGYSDYLKKGFFADTDFAIAVGDNQIAIDKMFADLNRGLFSLGERCNLSLSQDDYLGLKIAIALHELGHHIDRSLGISRQLTDQLLERPELQKFTSTLEISGIVDIESRISETLSDLSLIIYLRSNSANWIDNSVQIYFAMRMGDLNEKHETSDLLVRLIQEKPPSPGLDYPSSMAIAEGLVRKNLGIDYLIRVLRSRKSGMYLHMYDPKATAELLRNGKLDKLDFLLTAITIRNLLCKTHPTAELPDRRPKGSLLAPAN